MNTYFGRNRNTRYVLDTRIGGGGEGEVYTVQGRKDLAAKIYYDSRFAPKASCSNPRQYLKEKILTMLDQPVNPYMNGVLTVAWPQDILCNQQGQFVGYTMPLVKSKYHIFAASRERERVQLFPDYNWRTAVTIAYNLALTVKNVHASDAVIGDFNPNNIMLDEKGHVTLIDADSFNVVNKRTGKIYKCMVGVPEMLAPELQGKDLSAESARFTKETDCFALSIHIFNLLMNNCHPFGCTQMNTSRSSTSVNPVVRNITGGYCPYFNGEKGNPNAPDMKILPKEIRNLFERAFQYNSASAVKRITIEGRPSANEWQSALYHLYKGQFHTCRKDHSHVYPAGYTSCPWCALGNRSIVNRTARSVPSLTQPKAASTNQTRHIPAVQRRDSWPLWLTCIAMGCICSPFIPQNIMYRWAAYLNVPYSHTFGMILLVLGGGIAGGLMAYAADNRYRNAYNAWPLLLPGFAAPAGGYVIALIFITLIFLLIITLQVLFGVLVCIALIAGLFGMLEGY